MRDLMQGFQEAPNSHPIFLHFPLVLLPVALLFWIIALAVRRDEYFKFGRWLLYLAVLSAAVAVWSGLAAESQVGHDTRHHELVHRHKTFMLVTSGLAALLGGAAFFLAKSKAFWVKAMLTGGLAATVTVMTLGADQGGHAVFGHGIGTRVQSDGPLAEVAHPDLEHGHARRGEKHDGHAERHATEEARDGHPEKRDGRADSGHKHEATKGQAEPKHHEQAGRDHHDEKTSKPTVPPQPEKTSAWVARNKRWPPRGPWMWSVRDRLPQLNVEFNGIDFGHAHLAETLLKTLKESEVERGRIEVLDFIFSKPQVPPDEEQIAATFARLAWEAQRAFNWGHIFHRSLYDLFASDVPDKEKVYRELLANYLSKPEALTHHRLDLHGKLWNFRESKAFSSKFPKFNTQIWAYHWLQAAAYDVQLMGDVGKQRELFKKIIDHYHGYLRRPPVEWQMMPMLEEGAPEFSKRFPEAAQIFNNLHMLHDNIDDILCRPDLYPTNGEKRKAILSVVEIYLHRNHEPEERRAEFHAPEDGAGHMKEMMKDMGPRPPSAADILEGRISPEPPHPPLNGGHPKKSSRDEDDKHHK